jgi:chromosome segregation ATPase
VRLREIAVDSQFAALLVHVLESAQNRATVEDALLVAHTVASGIPQTAPDVDDALFSTLASGFAAVNRERHETALSRESKLKAVQTAHLARVQELEVERDLNAGELGRLRELSERSSSEAALSRERAAGFENENAHLKRKLQAKRLKLRAAAEALRNSETELMTLSLQATQHEQEANASMQRSAKLKTRVQSLKQSDAERQALQSSCDVFQQRLHDMEGHVRDGQGELRTAAEIIKRERARRKEIEQLLTASQARVNDLATACSEERLHREEADRQNERFEAVLKKKNEMEMRAAETVAALQKELDQVRREKAEAEADAAQLQTAMQKQSARFAEARKDRRDLIALAQLIHRITDGRSPDIEAIRSQIGTLE